ncbi:TetR/AcrR family transcriptional regulator [Solicola gregarius]|uniref:TetR family transcriptional regulator n=1 Tax=Solicola gregarius TaxID=2908642 RepID=A0AA46TEY3_9ACTN|nr:TetR family transcriptional regulator [Solicola gregarius]UYM03905.1 TetR family transcriptional regulator [Solicola gregarius]
MPIRARLSQERSRERRDALLDAAIELFAESGTRGVTHRAVAARAGLPTASTTYYFSSIDELVREALLRHLENWITELEGLTTAAESIGTVPPDPVDLIAQILAARPTELVTTQLSILLAAARDPQLRPTMIRMLESLEDVAASLLTRLGARHPERIATSAIALVAGHALDRLSERHTTQEEATILFRTLRSLIVADLLDKDERTSILGRLGANAAAG